jgi:tetratricopeptide (TPR) repeat protein
MTKLYTFIAAALLLLAACKSASKAYDHGNYTEAVEIAVKKLQKDPSDGELKTVAKNAYQYAVRQHEEEIRNLSASNSPNRWEGIYRQYTMLQNLYENIQRSPAAMQAVKPVSYADYVATYKSKTGDFYFEDGLQILENAAGDRNQYKQAYYAFRNALNFKPADRAIIEKMEEARDAATIYVMMIPMENYGGYLYTQNYQVRNFQNDLMRTIRNHMGNEFVQMYTEWEGSQRNLRPDEVLSMRLGSFSIGRPYDEAKVREVTKEVVVKETVYSKDSVVKEWAKVKARITTTQRMLISNADLYLHIADARNRTLWSETIRSEHRWSTSFTTYTGDERALSESDKELLKKGGNTPPREEAVMEELLRKLHNDVAYRVRDFYRRDRSFQ